MSITISSDNGNCHLFPSCCQFRFCESNALDEGKVSYHCFVQSIASLLCCCVVQNVRDVFEEVFKNKAEGCFPHSAFGLFSFLLFERAELDMNMVYDVAHNIAKFEEHLTDKPIKVLVHRKGTRPLVVSITCLFCLGATRSFGPGSPEIPEKYRLVF